MLIGIDASRANRKYKSGTEWYAYHLIRALARIDSVNTYVLYSDEVLSEGLVDLTCNSASCNQSIVFDKDGFQVLRSPHNNFKAKVVKWPFKFFWTLGGLSWEMLCHKPDVLFVPSHTLPLIRPRHSYTTIHDIGFKRQEQLYSQEKFGYRGRFIKYLIRILTGGHYQSTHLDYLDWSTKFALKHASKIITISDFSKQELIDVYGAKVNQIAVVHNGYDATMYQKPDPSDDKSEILAKHGLTKPYIFYVGRLEKKKNTATLIHAFALLKQAHKDLPHKLVLVGNASYGFDEIKYCINEFDLERDVVITGWIEETDMPGIFQNADCFVFPTLYEGFGIPLLEAMASGTAIVASDIAPVREVVGESAVLFNPDNAQDIANKIYELLSDEERRQSLIKSGYQQVERFGWEQCARETLEVLEGRG